MVSFQLSKVTNVTNVAGNLGVRGCFVGMGVGNWVDG